MVRRARHVGKGSASRRRRPAARARCCGNVVLGADTRKRDALGDDPLLPLLCSQGPPSWGQNFAPSLSPDTRLRLREPVCVHARRRSRLTFLIT